MYIKVTLVTSTFNIFNTKYDYVIREFIRTYTQNPNHKFFYKLSFLEKIILNS